MFPIPYKNPARIEKIHLRGLLCGHSPAEIAETLQKQANGVEDDDKPEPPKNKAATYNDPRIITFDKQYHDFQAAGDINSDGIDDLIIGAAGATVNDLASAGKVYAVFGSNQTLGCSIDPQLVISQF